MVKQSDIAKALGISIGTVDRALHNRGRIEEKTRLKVLEAAESMGYRPNLAASVLASRRRLRISINLPKEIAYFYDQVRMGIQAEHEAIAQAALDLEFRSFTRIGVGEREALKAAIDAGVQGIITVFGNLADVPSLVQKASQQNIKIVSVVTGTPQRLRVPTVSISPRSSGETAAGLIAGFTQRGGKVAVETGDLQTWEHSEKVDSFSQTLKRLTQKLKLLPAIETHDRPEVAYRETLKLIDQHKNLVAFYVSTSNSLAIIKALKRKDLLGKVILITTDLAPGLFTHLRSGVIAATIHERPRVQGELALRSMYGLLSDSKYPNKRVLLQPHVVMGANLDAFLTNTSASAEEALR